MLWLRIFLLLLLDPPRYLQPYHLPLLADVVSFRFFTHAAEYLVRISIVFQEIAHDSPDILMWSTTPGHDLIEEVGDFIDQRIADRLACKLVYLTHDVGCFLLNTGTLFLHFFGTPGEEASYAPMLCTTGLKIACLLPFGNLSFKLTLQKRTDRAGEGGVWCSEGGHRPPACPAGLLLLGRRVSRADSHRAGRSRAIG
jgi:hypothetical protein